MLETIGTACGRVENIDALLGGGDAYGGGPATIMDPATFLGLLALKIDDLVTVGHVTATMSDALDWLIHADTHLSIPFVSDDGQLGRIPLRSLARTMPQASLAPAHATAFRSRIDRLDAERSLAAATDAETRALLALAV